MHIDESHRRFIKNNNRQRFAQELQFKSPSIVELDSLRSVETNILNAGNLNNVPSRDILKKISSENIRNDDLDSDPMIHLFKLQMKLSNESIWQGKVFSGYIQHLCVSPFFFITLHSEYQIKHLFSIKKKPIFLYLDSTGSIVAKPNWINKKIFYYALVLRGYNNAPVPVAECISSRQNVPTISYFLSQFVYNTFQIRKTLKAPLIKKVETDGSMALMQSVQLAFNKMSLSQYLLNCWYHIIGKNEVMEKITILHMCSSHVFHSVARDINKFCSKKYIQYPAKKAMAYLINSRNILAVEVFLGHVYVVFGQKYKSINFDNSFKYITSNTPIKRILGPINNLHVPNMNAGLRKSSPFYIYFKNVLENMEIKVAFPERNNEFYSPQFVKILEEKLLPLYPLWSGIIIQKFKLIRDSNAPVENWFKIVKQDTFRRKLRLRPARFINTLSRLLKARIDKFNICLQTTRQKRNKVKKSFSKRQINKEINSRNFSTINMTTNLEICEEQWGKKQSKVMKHQPHNFFDNFRNIITPETTEKYRNTIEQLHTPVKCSQLTSFNINRETINSNKKSKSTLVTQTAIGSTPVNYYMNFEQSFGNISSINNDTRSRNVKQITRNLNPELSSSTLLKPWDNICGFPQIPSKKIIVCGFEIFNNNLQTLYPQKWLDDNIINCFLQLVKCNAENNNIDILPFDSMLVSKLIDGINGQQCGLYKWAEKNQILYRDIWLLPISNDNNHWTLLVIVFMQKIFLYLDSLHGYPPQNLIKKLMCFLNSQYFIKSQEIINWKEWNFYVPNDIPKQTVEGGNCGVHVCMWAFLISTGLDYKFNENDMINIRMWLMKLLIENNNKMNNMQMQRNLEQNRNLILTDDTILRTKFPKNCVDLMPKQMPPKGYECTFNYCINLHNNLFDATLLTCAFQNCSRPKEIMVYCTGYCKDWYHRSCIDDNYFINRKKYLCPACR